MDKHNTELTNLLYSAGTGKPEKQSNAPDARRRAIMVAMWQRMSDYFGGSWQGAYGGVNDPAIYAWTGSLNRYSEADLAGAIRSCENWDGKFPPTFPEFKGLVLASRARQNFTDKRMALEKSTGKPVALMEHLARSATSDVANRELARMHDLLAGKEIEEFQTSYHICGCGSRWPGLV